nr:MAG TPA: hypothetical protein [Caudoviricetes sp.]
MYSHIEYHNFCAYATKIIDFAKKIAKKLLIFYCKGHIIIVHRKCDVVM